MQKDYINLLEKLIYSTDKNYVISQLNITNNSLLLHYFAANYNWNSGFEIPSIILKNEYCDFGTGLLMFYYADGYRFLEDPQQLSNSSLEEWKEFIVKCYDKLVRSDFNSYNISFDPELTKIQKYKLKKKTPTLPDIIINKSQGESVNIPTL